MKCSGCYKDEVEGYCPRCRKKLFDGKNVSHILDFNPPQDDNLPLYQEQTKRLSISGVQLKYSLKLEGKNLVLTETGGQYILKPIPPTVKIVESGEAPENEHLTMQIASKVYGINTAANGIIYFKDGTPAYITRRFDLKADGTKYLQEDMAQISGRTRQIAGENFKYEGTYEEIGHLIERHVAASMPVKENFFKLVVFNYLFSNGDAHLKNFSLLQTDMGDYTLTPAYDLMSTVIHLPNETDVALQLFDGDLNETFYSIYGFYGQPSFRELGNRISLLPQRLERILTQLLSKSEQALKMISESNLSDKVKNAYVNAFTDKLRRMGMTQTMIAEAVNSDRPNVYGVVTTPLILTFRNGTKITGFFEPTPQSDELQVTNKYTFIELQYAEDYKKSKSDELITIVEGDQLISITYER